MSRYSTLKPVPARSQIIAVIGATGGCGATTLGVACAAERFGHNPSVLLDLQVASGLEVFLGIESVGGLRTSDVAAARGTLDFDELQQILPKYLGIPVLTARIHDSVQLDLSATQSILESARSYQGRIVVLVEAELLSSLRTYWDAILCVSPLTLMGAACTLALRNLLQGADFNVVTTAITRPEFTLPMFEKASGIKALGHVEPHKEISAATAIGNGPLGSGGRGTAGLRKAASGALQELIRYA